MARFNEASSSSRLKSGLHYQSSVLIAFLLVAVMQIPLSSQAFAEPENPKLANDRCL